MQLLSVAGRTPWILASGIGCGVLILAGLWLFGIPDDPLLAPTIASIAASSIGLGCAALGSHAIDPAAWFSPILAGSVPAAVFLKRNLTAQKCLLCPRKLRGLLSFNCPRCGLRVCEHCWVFEGCRCRRCHTIGAVLFKKEPNDKWWYEQFGPPTQVGRCVLCLGERAKESQETAALRTCPKCHNSQCQACWDDNNGQCSECGWVIPGVPAELLEYVLLKRPQR
jgi:hypothetical protein